MQFFLSPHVFIGEAFRALLLHSAFCINISLMALAVPGLELGVDVYVRLVLGPSPAAGRNCITLKLTHFN